MTVHNDLLNKHELPNPIVSTNAETVLKRRYLAKDEEGITIEDPKDMYIRVASCIANQERDSDLAKRNAEDFYAIMAQNDFLPNSPCLMNAGRPLGMLSACFVLGVEDDLHSIADTQRAVMLVQRAGGGTGFSFSNLRPSGSIVGSSGGTTSGPLSFIDAYSATTTAIQQGAFRRGANMAILNVDHPDIVDFINAKSDLSRWQNYNVSVGITDEFIEVLKNGRPTTHEVHHDKWGSGTLYKDSSTNKVIAVKNTDPRPAGVEFWTVQDTWNLICSRAHATGEPGLFFVDRANKNNPIENLGRITATNPCGEQPLHDWDSCLTGDSLVLTDQGVEQIDTMVSRNVLGTDRKLQKHKGVLKKGVKTVYTLTLSNKLSIRATNDHKFLMESGIFKELKDIKIGERINVLTGPTIQAIGNYDEVYEMFGWMHGDGWYSQTVGISFNYKDGDNDAKERLLPKFHEIFGTTHRSPLKDDGVSYQLQTEKQSALKVCADMEFAQGPASEKQLPATFYEWNLKQQLSFMRGLFGADGSISGKSNSQVQLASTSIMLLEQVQKFLAALGIHSSLYTSRFFKGNRKDQHKLNISKESANHFVHYIGFSTERKNKKFVPGNYKDEYSYAVDTIENAGKDEVYDLWNVTNTHAFYANGIGSHNCNLGSINLANFISNGQVDFERLEKVTATATRFLDNVIDANNYPIPQIEEMAKKTRRIGLGVMGWADVLFQLRIPYNSQEALDLARTIMKCISTTAFDTSRDIAVEKDNFLAHEGSSYSGPMRNSYRTTVAPTGTISVIADCSCGIEPLFALSFTRRVMPDDSGKFVEMQEVNQHFVEAVNNLNIDQKDKDRILEYVKDKGNIANIYQDLSDLPHKELDVLKSVFVTASEIDYKDHIFMQDAWQEHVDSAISKTINLPRESTVNDVNDAYMLALDLNLKGITVYRDGSRDNIEGMKQPMSTSKTTAEKETKKTKNKTPLPTGFSHSVKTSLKTQFGTLHVSLVLGPDNRSPIEFFAQIGKAGDVIASDLEAICRLGSMFLRSGGTLEDVVDQLQYIGSTEIMPSQHGKITSLPDALAKVLKAYNDALYDQGKTEKESTKQTYGIVCPECKGRSLKFSEGCKMCDACGFSAC